MGGVFGEHEAGTRREKRKGLVDSFFLSRQHRSTRSEPSEP